MNKDLKKKQIDKLINWARCGIQGFWPKMLYNCVICVKEVKMAVIESQALTVNFDPQTLAWEKVINTTVNSDLCLKLL